MKVIIGILILVILITQYPTFNTNAETLLPSKAHVYLHSIDGNSRGKMTYDQSGIYFSYQFTGHNLLPNTPYSLMYYPDTLDNIGLICIGEGVTDNNGNILLKNDEAHITSMPFNRDLNSNPLTTTYPNNQTGAKIWLVKSSQVNCSKMKLINLPLEDNLIEDSLIFFKKW